MFSRSAFSRYIRPDQALQQPKISANKRIERFLSKKMIMSVLLAIYLQNTIDVAASLDKLLHFSLFDNLFHDDKKLLWHYLMSLLLIRGQITHQFNFFSLGLLTTWYFCCCLFYSLVNVFNISFIKFMFFLYYFSLLVVWPNGSCSLYNL